jgi:hypothetical protein
MSIELQFYNIIIPIHILEEKVAPFKEIIKWDRPVIERWHDEYLYREGCMSDMHGEQIISFWKEKGLTPTIIKKEKEKWNDLCAMDMLGGLMLPCDWIRSDFIDPKNPNQAIAWIKGKL